MSIVFAKIVSYELYDDITAENPKKFTNHQDAACSHRSMIEYNKERSIEEEPVLVRVIIERVIIHP